MLKDSVILSETKKAGREGHRESVHRLRRGESEEEETVDSGVRISRGGGMPTKVY